MDNEQCPPARQGEGCQPRASVSWTMNHSEDPCLPPSKGCSFQGVVPHGLSAGRQQDGKDLPR